MLAPRKKLWSTPPSAVDAALAFAALDANDVVFDVGCGDARVLLQMAALSVPLPTPLTDERGVASGGASSEVDGGCGDNQQHQSQGASTPPQHRCHQFVGIEISPERAEEARGNTERARQEGRIPPHVSIEIICANALDTEAIEYARATVIFLYLVPRGLRLIKDVVWPKALENEANENGTNEYTTATANGIDSAEETTQSARGKRPRRIITYMAPFENTSHVRKELCTVEHQEGAAWPVYLYYASV
ncbi:hypothetical protein ACHAXT_001371 [Thalassiosira profunda]